MTPKPSSLLLACLLLALLPGLAPAQTGDPAAAATASAAAAEAAPAKVIPSKVDKPRVSAQLLADVDAVTPGEPFRVGVAFDIAPDWHMYWVYPGDVGLPTELTLEGPDGLQFGEVQWPAPHRFESKTGLVSYGYKDKLMPFVEVRPPAGALEGEELYLTARVRWLVCRENCIPGSATLALTLPVQSGGTHSSRAAPGFDKVAAEVPTALPADLRVEPFLSLSGVAPGNPFEVVLLVHSTGGALEAPAFFPSPADGLDAKQVTVLTSGPNVPPGGALVRVGLIASSDPGRTGARLDGVLRANRGGLPLIVETSAPIRRLAAGEPGRPVVSALFASAAAAPTDSPARLSAAPKPAPAEEGGPSLATMLLFAFLGGLILNIMPCVLPVLSIKILGLVQQADEDRKTIWYHGLSYTGGILLSFAILGAVVIVLKASGEAVGWGFQFQEPAFVAAIGAIVFTFGLSLFGVFEVRLPGSGGLHAASANSHGYGGSFMNGVLATVLATPCTAPFLAPALGFALAQPASMLMFFLLTIGFGLAFPFLLMAAIPAWAKLLPKPGPWMDTFKKAMGFLLMATTVWLIDVLGAQWESEQITGYLGFLTVLAVAAWIYGHWGSFHFENRTRITALVAAVALSVAGGSWLLTHEPEIDAIAWDDFGDVDVMALAESGQTVFIDFTADWCVTCKVYERTVIDTTSIKGALEDGCVRPVKADYTMEDPEITRWLERFQRPGVPMYVILPAGRPHEPLLLPDVLTESSLLEGLEKAGPTADSDCPG